VRKLSPGKITLAGEKQVYRRCDADGRCVGDVIGVRDEAPAPGKPLLETVMEGGRLLRPHPPLEEIRRRFQQNFADLPDPHKALKGPSPYPVEISRCLRALQERL
jgi:nicotinate phosphoribosyltransferase